MKGFYRVILSLLGFLLLTGCQDREVLISFETNGGNIISVVSKTDIETSGLPIPIKEGYTFIGWYKDVELTESVDRTFAFNDALTLYAKWEENSPNTFTITFETNGGSVINPISANEGSTITPPTSPEKTGYTFDGWYSDSDLSTLASLSVMPNQNVVYYAKWQINAYTISFVSNEGSAVNPLTIDYQSSIVISQTSERLGYQFIGWYTDNSLTQLFNLTTMPANNITLYAKWQINTYTISFVPNEGSVVNPLTIDYQSSIIISQTSVKLGYQFVGWYTDHSLTQLFNLSTMPANNITLYAKWQINTYTISFVPNEGSAVNPLTIDYQSSIVISQTSERLGYQFAGWYTDNSLTQLFALTTMPANNITLYAKWDYQNVTITFDTQGGSAIEPILGDPGAALSAPIEPTKEGFVFCGWFISLSSVDLYTFETFPSSSLTLFADWGTEGLEYILLSDEQTYEVGIGSATEALTFIIPKYYEGKKVVKIMDDGFSYANIEEIILSNTVEEIGNRAFMYASYLTNFTLPDSLEQIGSSVFRFCYELANFTVSSENDYFTAMDGILFSKNLDTLQRYPQAKAGASYIVPNSVITIAEDAFSDADNLVTLDLGNGVTTIKSHAFFHASSLASIVIPNQVTEVELYAFRECTALSSVSIGTGLTMISSYMFDSCTSLVTIVIPYNILTIAYGEFYNCTHLENVYIVRTSINGLIQGSLFMFVNNTSLFKINCPDQMTVDAYKTAYYWSSYATKIQIGTL